MDEYADVFARHQGRLRRVAEMVAGDADVAADAVAEAFARTYPHWRRGRVDDVGAYLRRAMLNEIQRTWRKRRAFDGAAPGGGDGVATDEVVAERDRMWRRSRRSRRQRARRSCSATTRT
jgi:DNA-directed RNA polymerase specialized sigma24 family protein